MTEATRKVLDDVFDAFDFERVKKVMDALDWKWAGMKRYDAKDGFKLKTMEAVPTVDEIKTTAADLMLKCAESDIDVLAACGFRVEKDCRDGAVWMRLSFDVEEMESEVLI